MELLQRNQINGKHKFLSTIRICIYIILIKTRRCNKDVYNHDKYKGMQYTLVDAVNLSNRRLLTNDLEEKSKTVKQKKVSFAYSKSEQKNDNETKLTSTTLRENSFLSNNINIKSKKKKFSILEFLKKIDKYGEEKAFKHLSYLYNLKKDPNITKKLFIKKVFRRYWFFISSPILIKSLEIIVPIVVHVTDLLETYPFLSPVYVTFNVVVTHFLGAVSILYIVYLLIKKIKFDMIADKNPKLCYTEFSSFMKNIFV
ncbi:Plasmodium exported protein, unknown function [Plasmodium vivax]|nr:unnamed protein product [Plasmodium vivax]CAI7723924.1 Plasmodium exported protein, unknown function [Plasmodium vivax]SCO70959.1 Plasmodium exported protein, unknown function [Plasmodium vivax]VUZ93449.1 Plasmodium exported protein, unknown function [Plasmodium vivax]